MTTAVAQPATDPCAYGFLARCVRAVFDASARIPVDDAEVDGLDWSHLARLARENRVDALLLQGLRLRSARPSAIPLMSGLEEYVTVNRRRNEDSAKTLARLAASLAAARVDVLVFKGPVTAWRFYPDPGLRFFWDLDFLVRLADLPALHAVLTGEGHRREGELTPRERRLYEHYHFADAYEPGPQGGPEIDVHWRLFPASFPVACDDAGLWARAEPCAHPAGPMRTLSAVDAFVYAASHGAKEEWRRLQMVADIAAMLASPEAPDLPACLARADEWRVRRHLLLALHLAHRLLGASLPDAVRAAVEADAAVAALADTVVRRQSVLAGRGTSIFAFNSWRFNSFDSRLARWRYAWRTVSTPRVEHLSLVPVPIPPALLVPVRLLHDYVARPVRSRLRGSGGASTT